MCSLRQQRGNWNLRSSGMWCRVTGWLVLVLSRERGDFEQTCANHRYPIGHWRLCGLAKLVAYHPVTWCPNSQKQRYERFERPKINSLGPILLLLLLLLLLSFHLTFGLPRDLQLPQRLSFIPEYHKFWSSSLDWTIFATHLLLATNNWLHTKCILRAVQSYLAKAEIPYS